MNYKIKAAQMFFQGNVYFTPWGNVHYPSWSEDGCVYGRKEDAAEDLARFSSFKECPLLKNASIVEV